MSYHAEVGTLLLLSWGVCWFFFFFVYGTFVVSDDSARGIGLPDRRFAYSAYATGVIIVLWAVCAWSGVGEWRVALDTWHIRVVVVAGILCVLGGQICMVLARSSIRFLSNKEVFFTLSTVQTKGLLYNYIKHPMYVGLWLALVGSSLVLLNIAALCVSIILIGPILALRASFEGC